MTVRGHARKAEERDGFRPDIEGLRAVAVVLVVLYHARILFFGGGYIGVDVFFVLSGFLITGLLLRELERSGTVSLPNFYARRMRRLLPAAALVLLATMIASAILLPPLQVPEVGKDAAAASLYVSNIRFALQATDYLQAEQAPSPLLHFWSLGVEEQFYFFWPAIVMLVGRGAAGFRRRVGTTALVISLASLALAVVLTATNGPWAFFSLPTRAWELGIGALLAVIGARFTTALAPNVAALLGWLGLGMVALSGVVFSVDTPFPGTAALLPTLGSALVIVAGFRPGPLAVARPLSTPVPRFLGRISYSLYLWHWPVLVLPAAAGLSERIWVRVALVGLAIVLAAATQRWIEDPIRRGRFVGTIPRRNLAMAGALSFAVATVSLGLGANATNSLAGSGPGNAGADEVALDKILGGGPTASPGGASISPSRAPLSASPGVSAAPTPAVPGSSASPTPGPSPLVPATVDGPVPDGLRPSLADARTVLPDPYSDGCHLDTLSVESPACVYGDPNGSTTIVVFGDSHALSWWPAVERISVERGWRFVSLTKSACDSADVLQWKGDVKRIYTECATWRANSLKRIEAEHPAMVILANSRAVSIVAPDGTPITGAAAIAEWTAGLARTIGRIDATVSTQVVVLGDTPRSRFDVPVCLSAHRDSTLACATPFDTAVSVPWLDAAAAAANLGAATYVDPTPWVCPSRPCPAVIGNFMVLRDEHHLALPFAAALGSRLEAALPAVAGH